MRMPSGVTDEIIYFMAFDATDNATPETGLTSFTVYRDRNGGGATAMTTPTVTEVSSANMPGLYKLLLDEDMTIGSGNDSEEMVFHITQASMAPVTRTIELYRLKITAGNTLGVESDGDLTKVNTLNGHTAQTGDSFARIGAAGASLTDLGGMSTGMKAEVNVEAKDVLFTDTDAEPSSIPAATSTLADKISWLFTLSRNNGTQTSTTKTLGNDADSTDIATSAISDDGATFTRNKWS